MSSNPLYMLTSVPGSAEHKALPADPHSARVIGGLIAWTLLVGILSGTCCAASSEATFEVASIKRAAALSEMQLRGHNMLWERRSFGPVPGHDRTVELVSITLPQLIAIAYSVRTPQVIGPKQLDSGRFDIRALLPQGAPRDLATEMLKSLLRDRFALRMHPETRNESGLLLVVGRGGPHLKAADPSTKGSGADVGSILSTKREVLPRGAGRFWSRHCTMAMLVDYLLWHLHMPIADRTGLKGEYDVVLDIAPAEDPDGFDRQVRIIDAVRKLGLDLKRGKMPVNVVVVDSVSKEPTAN